MYPESLVVLVLFCDVVFRFLILPPGTESTYQVESLKDASLLLHASLSLLLNLLRTSSHTSSGVVQLYKNPGDGSRRQRDKRTLAEQIQARSVSQLVSSVGKNLVNHLTQKKVENRALGCARHWGK
jgi:hypothetical protein